MQKRLLQLLASKSPEPHLQRIEFPVDEVLLLPWLAAQNFEEKIYWYDRQTQTEIAGIGCADRIHTEDPSDYFNVISRITKKLSSDYPEMRYFGGFSFNNENGHDPYWHNFGNNAFFLPLFEIIRKGKTYLCAMNFSALDSNDFSSLVSKIEMIEEDIPELTDQIPFLINHTHYPDKTGWDTMLDQALTEIEKQDFEKIV